VAADAGNLDDPADSTNWVHDRPSATIVAHSAPTSLQRRIGASPAMARARMRWGRCGCPPQKRLACKSFPDNYPWQGKKTSVYQQSWKTPFSPLMAEAILRSARNGLECSLPAHKAQCVTVDNHGFCGSSTTARSLRDRLCTRHHDKRTTESRTSANDQAGALGASQSDSFTDEMCGCAVLSTRRRYQAQAF